MNKGLYGRLALSNLKKNGKIYLPYLLTCIGTIMMFYLMQFLYTNPWVKTHPSLGMVLGMGCVVVGLFAFIFLFYTNSFLMKQRKKEIGLYNILGMEKRHIGRIMFYENIYIGLLGIGIGLLCGILFSKLMLLLLGRLLGFKIGVTFYVSIGSVITTVIFFGIIFILTLVYNLQQIHLAKPVELLQGGNTGEKEPKTKWLLAILGLVTLGAGYYMALTTQSPMEALVLFFIAVILVIIGTYCIFTAGSIAGLKFLRNRKGYFYKLNHFTSVSGMIYRMKQNAVGLANICILSTMVLVMISTTSCLFIGSEDALRNQNPRDVYVKGHEVPLQSEKQILGSFKETLKSQGLKGEEWVAYCYRELYLNKSEEGLVDSKGKMNMENTAYLRLIPLEEYNWMEGKNVQLNDNEVLVYSPNAECKKGQVLFKGKELEVVKQLTKLNVEKTYNANYMDVYFVILPEHQLTELVKEFEKENKDQNYSMYMGTNVDCTDEKQIELSNKVYKNLEKEKLKYGAITYGAIASDKDEFLSVYGGLFFLGIFLGTLFTMAMILIIYYKQISEGYDDKRRFEIMQKVGMSKREVKKSIQSQVKIVFFIPLVTAVIHLAFAFSMIKKLLSVLSLTNVALFIGCTIVTVLAFTILYSVVYVLTAKTYYKIVES